MVCIKSPQPGELQYDSGKIWDTGWFVDWGIRAYYTASGPTAGDWVKRGGSFHLEADLMVQSWRDSPGENPMTVGWVNPQETQEVRFGGDGVEFHPVKCEDPKSDTYNEGGLGINQGVVEGNAGFDKGILGMLGRVSSLDIESFGVGALGLALTLPSGTEANLIDFKAQIEWSFTIMTRQEYFDRYGNFPE